MSVARSNLYSHHEQSNCAPQSNEVDPETAALIARFALEDLEEATERRNGKGKSRSDAPMSDAELAYQLQSENYKEMLTYAEDVKYAQSLNSAAQTDAAYHQEIFIAEEIAAHDRQIAKKLSRDERSPLGADPWQTVNRFKFKNQANHRSPLPRSRNTPPRPVNNVPIKSNVPIRSNGSVKSAKGKQRDVHVMKQEPPSTSSAAPESPFEDIDFEYNYKNPYLSRENKSAHNNMSSVGSGPSGIRDKTVQCTVCDERLAYDDALHTPCDHHYCAECTSSLVDKFTRDDSLYPLRCCRDPINITSVYPFISPELKTQFLEKHAELSTPSQNRLYCVNSRCSTFLGSSEDMMDTGIICPICQTATCPRCKQVGHGEENCKIYATTLELGALANQAGWQTCPGCHNLVELTAGCYHITCICRTQFCYLCTAPWKTCECPRWDEVGLAEVAPERIENELGTPAAQRIAPEIQTWHMHNKVEQLRGNRQCNRHNWHSRNGGGKCGKCKVYVSRYLMLCKSCSLLLCRQCSDRV